ncbi:6084_t:CDS:2 [Acaulospora morrowiae]|uniref:6084_t:CDS:1 n=1 Tax=Acaulospora morrowiae TaxID=94023 RepID=A0A9N9FX11_9GLOM|nr:6084_t:CDS:2 [Acaulospora morrowiae]
MRPFVYVCGKQTSILRFTPLNQLSWKTLHPEYAKIIIFLEAMETQFDLNALDVLYLVVSLILPAVLIIDGTCDLELIRFSTILEAIVQEFNKFASPLLLLWIFTAASPIYIHGILEVLYTNYTSDEMGDVPFTCPASYDYEEQIVRIACIIRTSNIICMWLFAFFLALWIIAECFGLIGDDEEVSEKFSSSNREIIFRAEELEDEGSVRESEDLEKGEKA